MPVKKASTHTALMAWLRMVAMAAPCTPMLNPKMNTGSRMMLLMAPMQVVAMLVLAKPWLVIKGVMPKVNCTKRVPSR